MEQFCILCVSWKAIVSRYTSVMVVGNFINVRLLTLKCLFVFAVVLFGVVCINVDQTYNEIHFKCLFIALCILFF